MSDRQLTFDRIKQSEAYADRAARVLPSDMRFSVGTGCSIVFVSVWCLLVLVIGGNSAGMAARSPFSSSIGSIVPALMFLVGIVFLANLIYQTAQYSKAPTQATAAIVVSKHSRGRGEYSRNFITLEFEDGRRHEFTIRNEERAALVGVGDEGVAFTRFDVFLAFDRVP
ncbi:MAG: hypothetical protein IPL60_06810 [Ardenticatenia bacterium]|nr:hypothetical protein [Ardenticatenia bacterium]